MTVAAVSDSTIKPQEISSSTALIGNTLMTGVAVSLLFGPAAAAACMVTNVALANLSGQSQKLWLPPLDTKVVEELKDYWENSPHYFTVQVVIGTVFKVLGVAFNQVALNWLKDCLKSPHKALFAIFDITVLGPIVEETIFRGFLQEKIKDIQIIVFGKETADNRPHTITRIALQAIAFSSAHYHVSQGLFNIIILLSTGLMGFIWGEYKEEKSNIWSSTAMHAHMNSAVTSRVCVFGT